MKTFLTIILLTLFSTSVLSNDVTYVENIEQDLLSISSAIDETQRENYVEKTWNLSRVRVRVRVKGGLDIAGLTKFEVKPWVELFYDKKK